MNATSDVFEREVLIRDLESPLHLTEQELWDVGNLYHDRMVYRNYSFIQHHLQTGGSQRTLAKMFGVSTCVIQRWIRHDPIMNYIYYSCSIHV